MGRRNPKNKDSTSSSSSSNVVSDPDSGIKSSDSSSSSSSSTMKKSSQQRGDSTSSSSSKRAAVVSEVTIPADAVVCVIGATGYMAEAIIRELLLAGCTVHCTVRRCDFHSSSNNNNNNLGPVEEDARFQYLFALAERCGQRRSQVKLFEADLLDAGHIEPWQRAMEGCSVVFYTTSPTITSTATSATDSDEDVYRNLVQPIVDATKTVLAAVSATNSVRRVVMTSTCAAIHCTNTEKTVFHRNDWNTTATVHFQPYALAKTLSEQTAWILAGSTTHWNLIVLNPAVVIGHNGVRTHYATSSSAIFYMLGNGSLAAGYANFGFGFVDVRIVAKAHLRAAFGSPSFVAGRYILSGHSVYMSTVVELLYARYGPVLPPNSIPPPTLQVPKWVMYLLAPYLPGNVPRKQVWECCQTIPNYDCSETVSELGIDCTNMIALQDSVYSMFEAMLENGVFTNTLPNKNITIIKSVPQYDITTAANSSCSAESREVEQRIQEIAKSFTVTNEQSKKDQ